MKPHVPSDYDGVKDKHNDIKYCDRNSHYDEKIADLITDYMDLIENMKCLAMKHFRQIGSKEEQDTFQIDVENFLGTKAKRSKAPTGHHRKYRDLLKGRFELTKVLRIERENDKDRCFREDRRLYTGDNKATDNKRRRRHV